MSKFNLKSKGHVVALNSWNGQAKDCWVDQCSITNIIGLLQECKKQGKLDYAKHTNFKIHNNGLHSNKGINNYAVTTYMTCGSICDAQHAFNLLLLRDEYSWTSLISGYLKCGQTQHALNLYPRMQDDSVHPDCHTLTVLLKACAQLKDITRGQQIHIQVKEKALEKDLFVGTALVNMYAKCGLLYEAQEAFDKLPARNVVSWTALIDGYSEHGFGHEALACFKQMQLEGVAPNAITFVSSLKASSKIGAIDELQEIHTLARKKGFERDHFVGSTLVNIYARCGLLTEAREVFDILPVQTVVSWTALIDGYDECGSGEDALKCFEQMQQEGMLPNIVTFVCSLKACSSLGFVAKGREIHTEIAKRGLDKDLVIGNALVDMYAKCGSFLEAQEVFDKMPVRDVVSWNALIARYNENGLELKALKCLEEMNLDDVSPDAVTLVSTLKACGSMKALGKGRQIHAQIEQKRFERDPFVDSTLVDMYIRCGSILEAREVFDKLSVQNFVSWTTMIRGYVENRLEDKALECFEQMQLENIIPNTVTFAFSLKACASMEAVERGRKIHAQIIQMGYEKDNSVGNSILDMYAKCGSLVEAKEVFDNLPARDVVSWNVLVAGLAENGFGNEALECFKQMQEEGVAPNFLTFVCTLKICGSLGDIDRGREIHKEIARNGFEVEPSIGCALIDMYARCGLLVDAQEAFDSLPVRGLVAWTAIINGYVEHGSEQALNCFEQMQREGITPNVVTFICSLKACGSIGAIVKGREIHAQFIQLNTKQDHFANNALINMYVKCTSVAEAQDVFDKMPHRDIVSWNTLISGQTDHGLGLEVLLCLKFLQLEGLSPNVITYSCALQACGMMAAIDAGREIHHNILQGGLGGDILVGNSLVDMYLKCGLSKDARDVFDNMPIRDVVSWNILIAGYVDNGFSEQALLSSEQMQLKNIIPNGLTFLSILKACSTLEDIRKGREVHTRIISTGTGIDTLLGSTLMHMYAKCGSVVDAQEVFDRLPVRDIVAWNALIGGYVENGLCLEALDWFEKLQLEKIFPSFATFICSLKACGSSGSIERGREIHATILQNEIEMSLLIGNSLVDMYVKCVAFLEAWAVFDKLPVRDHVSWTTIIAGSTEYGSDVEALKCFEQMQLEGIHPDGVTLVCCLKACGNCGAIDRGHQIYKKITQMGLEKDLVVRNTFLRMYTKWGLLIEAQDAFDKLSIQDVVSWNTLIAGYAENGFERQALDLFRKMQLSVMTPNAATYICCLRACGEIAAADMGREIHIEVAHKGLDRDLFVGSTLVDMYIKCGSVADAQRVFDKLPSRNVVSWTAMIRGYGMNQDGNMAVHCFEKMQEQGIQPDDITFVCLLSACSRASLVAKGQNYFQMMKVEYGIQPTADHHNCMLDLFARAGHLYEAMDLLQSMSIILSEEMVTALLSACRSYGEADLGLKCFQHLVQMNPQDAASYVLMANIYRDASSIRAIEGIGRGEESSRCFIENALA